MGTFPSLATYPSSATFPSAPSGPAVLPLGSCNAQSAAAVILGPATPDVGSGLTYVSEPAPPRQVTVVTPNGYRYRWATDEPKAENIPQGLTFSSSMPGGSDQFSCSLLRDPERSYPDLTRLSDLYVGRAGGRTAQYRIEETPGAQGEQSIEVSGRGGRAALEDRADVKALFVDRDLSGWGGMSSAREIVHRTGGRTPVHASTSPDPDTGLPSVDLTGGGRWPTAGFYCEALYDAGDGMEVGRIYSEWKDNGFGTSFNARFGVTSTSETDGSTWSPSTDLLDGSGWGTWGTVDTTVTPGRYARMDVAILSAVSDDVSRGFHHQKVAVYGTHGLTPVGTPGGFFPGPMLEWLIQNHTQLKVGTIDPGTFLHEHAAYRDPGTALSIVENLSRYEPLYDWFVYDDEFHFRRRGSYGKRWRARVAQANLQSSGETVARLWNQVAVRTQDPYYGDQVAGPTGSGYANTSDLLIDVDPDNPANQKGITRRATLDIGEGTIAGAITVGQHFLEETKRLDNAGQATLEGLVQDDAGTWWPVDEVRAGDEISFPDSADTSWRHITRASYDDSSATASLDLDAPPETLDALLARFQAALIPLG